ncbi:hypothetical protein [Variovorax boronicumulans]
MKLSTWLVIAGVILALLAGIGFTLHRLGASGAQLSAVTGTAKANDTAHEQQKKKARADIKRAGQTGADRERDRAALDTLFQRLEQEAKDAPSADHDRYVLPDDRLRLWRAANAGPGGDRGVAAGEPDHASSASAAAALGRDRRAGSEPPAGSEGLPRLGLADVSPAGAPAASNRGL